MALLVDDYNDTNIHCLVGGKHIYIYIYICVGAKRVPYDNIKKTMCFADRSGVFNFVSLAGEIVTVW